MHCDLTGYYALRSSRSIETDFSSWILIPVIVNNLIFNDQLSFNYHLVFSNIFLTIASLWPTIRLCTFYYRFHCFQAIDFLLASLVLQACRNHFNCRFLQVTKNLISKLPLLILKVRMVFSSMQYNDSRKKVHPLIDLS